MGDKTLYDKSKYDELESDFRKFLDKGKWTPDDYKTMKDIQKLLYYIDVRCAMKEGDEYPGSAYMPPNMSYAQRRNSMGQFTSGDMNGWSMNGSGTYPHMDRNMYYDGMGMSGRRYYDSEREKAIHKLHHMMENTDDAERKSALNFALHALQDNTQ